MLNLRGRAVVFGIKCDLQELSQKNHLEKWECAGNCSALGIGCFYFPARVLCYKTEENFQKRGVSLQNCHNTETFSSYSKIRNSWNTSAFGIHPFSCCNKSLVGGEGRMEPPLGWVRKELLPDPMGEIPASSRNSWCF